MATVVENPLSKPEKLSSAPDSPQQDGEYSDAMLEDQCRALLTTEFSRKQLAEVVARSGKSESEILRLIDIIFEDR